MKNKVVLAFISSFLIIGTANAQDFQFTDKKVYNDYKTVEVCGELLKCI